MKTLVLLFVSLFLFSCTSSKSLIVTSKTEAQKKNQYEVPEKNTKITLDTKTTENNKVGVAKSKVQNTKSESVKTSGRNKAKKSLFNDVNEADIVINEAEINYFSNQLINNASDNLGSPYRGGGMTKAGFDCSGLVYSTFKNFEITLPRSSNSMSNYGFKVDRVNAKPGDLIFFRTNGKRVINHVGLVTEVYEDEIKFIHSSTSLGVIISSTKENYYSKTFAQVNRVVE